MEPVNELKLPPAVERAQVRKTNRRDEVSRILRGEPEKKAAPAPLEKKPDPSPAPASGVEGSPRDDAEKKPAPAQGEGQELEAKEKKPAPKTIKAMAESLGVSVEEMYEIQFELAGDKGAVKLGEIKDYLQEYGLAPVELNSELARRRVAADEAEESRERSAAESLAMRRELVGIIGAMGSVPREVTEAVAKMQRVRMQRELQLTLEAAPEWRDPERFQQDRREMVEIMRPYGFTKVEIDQIDDSRLMLFMRDQVRRLRQVRTLREKTKENAGGEGSPPNKVHQAPSARAGRGATVTAATRALVNTAKAGNKAQKISAVSALIKG